MSKTVFASSLYVFMHVLEQTCACIMQLAPYPSETSRRFTSLEVPRGNQAHPAHHARLNDGGERGVAVQVPLKLINTVTLAAADGVNVHVYERSSKSTNPQAKEP